MINENSKNDEEFLKSVKDQLYGETFMKDIPKYSSDRVETLVKMIELDERSDEEEAEECHANFDEQFLKITANSKKDRRKALFLKTVRTAAAMLVLVLLADVTSHAVMDESLFHVLNLWANQMAILPGNNVEVDTGVYQVDNAQVFTQVDEFAREFGNNFFICSWLPEGVKLNEILSTKLAGSYCYLWEYGTEKESNVISIRMYSKIEQDIAGLTGTEIRAGEMIEFANGISATVCANRDQCMVMFEYDNWWYIIRIEGNENVMKEIIGGMIKYE